MTRTHTYEREKNSMQKKDRTNEWKKENRTLTLAVFCDCFNFQRMLMFFFILSLCAVCIPVQQKIPAAAAAALINLLRYNIKCVCVCVFGTCLISRFLFILIWFLFMLLKFIRCHAVDFTLMSEDSCLSHSETDFKSVHCWLCVCLSCTIYSTSQRKTSHGLTTMVFLFVFQIHINRIEMWNGSRSSFLSNGQRLKCDIDVLQSWHTFMAVYYTFYSR